MENKQLFEDYSNTILQTIELVKDGQEQLKELRISNDVLGDLINEMKHLTEQCRKNNEE